MAVKMTGLDKLNRSLTKMPRNIQAALRVVMESSANEIVELAKRLAPEGDGDLKNSIGWTWSNKPPKGSMAIGSVNSGEDGLRIIIYAGDDSVFYARQVEFGTAAHTITSNKVMVGDDGTRYGKVVNHPGATPTPFFLPAYRSLRKRTRNRISRALNKAIKQSITK